jgi:lipoprotein-anchoring transpeptidase ErfK/SrfK
MAGRSQVSMGAHACAYAGAVLMILALLSVLGPSGAVAADVPAGEAPGQPQWVVPGAGAVKLVSPVAVSVQAGASTTAITIAVNGSVQRTVDCTGGAVVDMGTARLGGGANTITITATGPTGRTTTVSRTITRVEWPYNTCIVIDKSDYRLYWVRDQQLVASYPIAHGRNNRTPTRTWRILAKYKSAPHSIYGPRKMRLFKRIGHKGHYRYVSTPYLIHGTDEPKRIGTQASHGCIRMYNTDVRQLFPQVPRGTFVVTRR